MIGLWVKRAGHNYRQGRDFFLCLRSGPVVIESFELLFIDNMEGNTGGSM
jgi:hypothetical protein